jgi:putative FmdB family regulatory protein
MLILNIDERRGIESMPVYEYKCATCNTTYDIYHKGREIAEDIVCPSCKSSTYKKLMSAAGVSTKASSSPPESCGQGDCCGGGSCGMN